MTNPKSISPRFQVYKQHDTLLHSPCITAKTYSHTPPLPCIHNLTDFLRCRTVSLLGETIGIGHGATDSPSPLPPPPIVTVPQLPPTRLQCLTNCSF